MAEPTSAPPTDDAPPHDPVPAPPPLTGVGTPRTRVLICQARSVSAEMATALVDELAKEGFDAVVGTSETGDGDAEKDRLTDQVLEADCLVFLITPESVASEACLWEIAEAERLGKRIIPAVQVPVSEDRLPVDWPQRSFVFFDDDATRPDNFDKLVAALQNGAGWVREHTRLAVLAERWSLNEADASPLLRGEALDAAERWILSRPAQAPAPATPVLALIAESRRVAIRRQQWRFGAAAVAAVVAAVGLASFVANQSAQHAASARAEAQKRLEIEQRAATGNSEVARLEDQIKGIDRTLQQVTAERDAARRNEVKILSALSVAKSESGDSLSGMLIALEAFSNPEDKGERPLVPEANAALSRALDGPSAPAASEPSGSETSAAIARARAAVSRCLRRDERLALALPLRPPRWCITGPGRERETDAAKWDGKWPYHTQAWKDWLVAADLAAAQGDAAPPLPAEDTAPLPPTPAPVTASPAAPEPPAAPPPAAAVATPEPAPAPAAAEPPKPVASEPAPPSSPAVAPPPATVVAPKPEKKKDTPPAAADAPPAAKPKPRTAATGETPRPSTPPKDRPQFPAITKPAAPGSVDDGLPVPQGPPEEMLQGETSDSAASVASPALDPEGSSPAPTAAPASAASTTPAAAPKKPRKKDDAGVPTPFAVP